MNANAAINVVVEVIRANALGTRNSNTLVEIVRTARTTELGFSGANTVQNFTATPTSTIVNRGDRLRIRIFADDAGTMATGFAVTASWNGTTAAADGDTYVTFTENITFETAPGTHAVTQGASDNSQSLGSATATALGQSFVALAGCSTVDLWLDKISTGTSGNLILEIQTDSAGVPSETVLVSATMVAESLSTTAAYVSFSVPYPLVSGTTYWLVLRRDSIATGFVRWYYNTADVYASGTRASKSPTWATTTGDRRFVVNEATTTVYLTDTASDVATASVDREAWTSRGSISTQEFTSTAAGWTAPIQSTSSAGGTVVDWFTKQLNAFTLAGMAVANLCARELNVAANASLRCEIARVDNDGTNPTVWASWCMSPNNGRSGELNTTEAAETINISGDDLAIGAGQRLRFRVYIDDLPGGTMGASQTVAFFYNGTSAGASGDSYITLPVTLTEYTPAAAVENAQYNEPRIFSQSRQRALQARRF